MRRKTTLFFCMLVAGTLWAQEIFINELHYDNQGDDDGEGFEIAGPAGTDLEGYRVLLYNGSNGKSYGLEETLTGTIDDEGSGYGARWFPKQKIQNGPKDALALVDPEGQVLEFISYEGVVTAITGPATGMTSTDIGVKESDKTPVGHSLQRAKTGWRSPLPKTEAFLNEGQGLLVPVTTVPYFLIYPNPASGGHITIKTTNFASLQVSIYSVLGKVVYQQRFQAGSLINIENLSEGIYFLEVKQGNSQVTKKLLIK
ncbi:MAG: T9SS type A sorting domain-containing protein [Lutibacter sp.]|nr:T9SS type A sorting domain-containing protein [Lutibacter sp.]